MISHEGHPPLRQDVGPLRPVGHVTTDCARRNLNSDFQQKLIADSFLTPRRIARSHVDNQFANIGRNSRSADRTRLRLPKESESLSMPADQSGFTTVRTERHSNNFVS